MILGLKHKIPAGVTCLSETKLSILQVITVETTPLDIVDTVNSEIFARVLFSRYAKFREKTILTKWRNQSVVCWYS